MRLLDCEHRWQMAVLDTILPSGEGEKLPRGAAEVKLRPFVGDLLNTIPLEARIGLRASLWLLMVAPPFLLGRPRSFMALSGAERLGLLERMAASEQYALREIPVMLKAVAGLGYFGSPEVQRQMGLDTLGRAPAGWTEGQSAPARIRPKPQRRGASKREGSQELSP